MKGSQKKIPRIRGRYDQPLDFCINSCQNGLQVLRRRRERSDEVPADSAPTKVFIVSHVELAEGLIDAG